jgi:ABC-type branched-subunit amino acid transport system permease subunit
MIQRRLKTLTDSLRPGINTGFVVGLVIIFLILIGIPIRIEDLANFSFGLVTAVFGLRLARRLHDHSVSDLLKNAVAMGIAAGIVILLFMSLINRWQERGIDVKQYFDAINTKTMNVISGVPEAELEPNPARDPLTGEYPEGTVLRTDPMRLSFDSKYGVHLFNVNLHVGGFYGFLLLLTAVGVVAAGITRVAMVINVGYYRKQAVAALTGNPISHWAVLLLPILLFALLWLSVKQGTHAPILKMGDSTQEIQLLLSFGIILFGLVAVRAAQPNDWKLAYGPQLAICLGLIAALVALGIWRVIANKMYLISTSDDPNGNKTFSILVVVAIGALVAGQAALALRRPGRFEMQFTAALALLVLLLMPLYLDQYQNDVLTLVGINILLGLGLNIVVGYAGLLDLGYVAFFALGAYTYAFLSSDQQKIGKDGQPTGLKFAGNDGMVLKFAGWAVITVIVTLLVVAAGVYLWRRRQVEKPAEARPTLINLPQRPPRQITFLLTVLGIIVSLLVASLLDGSGLYHDIFNKVSPFLVGVVAGVIAAGMAGIALGIPVLRLRGDYLAIVTLGFGEIIRLLFNNLRDYTGGPQGVLQIPRPIPREANGPVTFLVMVYLVFMGAGLVAFASSRLKQGRIGRAWNAMRSDEDIAQSMGINLVQTKLTAFAIGAAFAGIGGVLFAARQRNIFPNDFQLNVSIEVLSLVIIGGMGSIPGVIVGAVALIGIPEVLRELETYRILAFGALLVVMVIIRPSGLLPAPTAQLRDRARVLAQQLGSHRQEGEQS